MWVTVAERCCDAAAVSAQCQGAGNVEGGAAMLRLLENTFAAQLSNQEPGDANVSQPPLFKR